MKHHQHIFSLLFPILLLIGCGSGYPAQPTLDVGVEEPDVGDTGAPDSQSADAGTDDSGMDVVDAGPSPPEPASFVFENLQNDIIYSPLHLSVTDRGVYGIGRHEGSAVFALSSPSPAFVDSWVEVAPLLTSGVIANDVAIVVTSPRFSSQHDGEGVWAWVIDLSEMKVVGTAPLGECVSPEEKLIVMNDSLAVIPCRETVIHVLDYSDPSAPRSIMRYEGARRNAPISVDGDADEFSFRYLDGDGIRRVGRDAFGIESDSKVSEFETDWIWFQMAIGGDRVWSQASGVFGDLGSVAIGAEGQVTPEVIRLSDLAELDDLESLYDGIAFHDQRLFLAGSFPDGKRIIVLDVQDPTSPVLVGSSYAVDDMIRVTGFAFHDDRVYIYGVVDRGGGREPIVSASVSELLD